MSTSTSVPAEQSASGWAVATISSAQRILDNISFTMKRETTETSVNRIQKLIDDANDGKSSPYEIISLSLYVDLLNKYDADGGFCHLRELTDRLNAHSFHVSHISEDLEEKQSGKSQMVA